MNRYQYKGLRIEVYDESGFEFGSIQSGVEYPKQYFGIDSKEHPVSLHGVKIIDDNGIVTRCILIGSGGATGVHQNSSLIDNDRLLICCSNTVFCLALPDLELNWKTKADQVTCFKIFKQNDDYIIHGEIQITKIDNDGKIKWTFSGRDIFVSIDNEKEFSIENEVIVLTDYSKARYKIDFDGNLIENNF